MQTVEEIWLKFKAEFVAEWDAAMASGKAGDLNHPGIFWPGRNGQVLKVRIRLSCLETANCYVSRNPNGANAVLQAYQQAFLAEVFADSLAFAGAVIIRRIVGIAHVIDFESIVDPNVRCCQHHSSSHSCIVARRGAAHASIC